MEPSDLKHNIDMFHQFPLENRKGEAFKCDVTGTRISEPYDSQKVYNRVSRAAGKYGSMLFGGKPTSETIVPISRESFHAAVLHPDDFGGREFVKEALKRLKTLEDSYAQTKDIVPEHENIHNELSAIRQAGEIAISDNLSIQREKFAEVLSSDDREHIKLVMQYLIEDIGKEKFGDLLAGLRSLYIISSINIYGRNAFIDEVWVHLTGDNKKQLMRKIPGLQKNENYLRSAAQNIAEQPNVREAAWVLERCITGLKLSGVETRYLMKLITEFADSKKTGQILNHVDSSYLKEIDLALGTKHLAPILVQYSEPERSEFVRKLEHREMSDENMRHNLNMLKVLSNDAYTDYMYKFMVSEDLLSEPYDIRGFASVKRALDTRPDSEITPPVIHETFRQAFKQREQLGDGAIMESLTGLARLIKSYYGRHARNQDDLLTYSALKCIHLAAEVALEKDLNEAAKLMGTFSDTWGDEKVLVDITIQYAGYPKVHEIVTKLNSEGRFKESL